MSMAAGTKLGPYEVTGPLGSGGMGEVYRAQDTRLGRDVAIKVLPADRLADPESRARFEREARAVAALNHPHIVTLHDVASADGVDFIVMEYVAGKTLDRLIPPHGMPCAEVLRLAIPMADAVARAHAAGIVHRDLKPSNVVVNAEGTVKVLDFGLAKLLGPGETTGPVGREAETATAPSLPGRVVGTTGYMSPEQASGRKVDARSDIFSFGVLLYEMVTGRRAFAGDSDVERLAAVLKDEPKPPSELVGEVPRDLERIIRHCLRKEPERRFQSMLDVKVELSELKEESDSQTGAPRGGVGTRRRRPWLAAWVAGGLLILATATGLTLWQLRRAEHPVPRLAQVTSEREAHQGSLSPDGSQIAFSSRGDRGDNYDIWLKIVGGAEARRLTTDPAADDFPTWSPDGKQIAFVRTAPGASSGAIYVVSPLGGPERRMSDFPTEGRASWSPDGRWLVAAHAEGDAMPQPAGILLIPADGGETHSLTLPKPPAFDRDAAFSPDGRALAYASCEGGRGAPACQVHVLALDGESRPRGTARRLSGQRFLSDGLAWTRDGLWILYGTREGANSRLWRVRADGAAPPERLELAGLGARQPSTASSRDRLVFTRLHAEWGIRRLQVGGTAAWLIESTFTDILPQYSADGRRVAFQSDRADEKAEIWLADADGTNVARLTRGPGRGQGSARWSPDGHVIAFDSAGEDGRHDIWTIRVDGSRLRRVTFDPADENMPSWSRDGRFLYYGSNRTGRYEIWRVPVAGGPEEQVTREGGFLPFESLDGRTLYYMRAESDGPLLARPTRGGKERTIASCVTSWGYAVGPRGVFHVDCRASEGPAVSHRALRHWDAATGRDRIASLDFEPDRDLAGISASPDGTTLLYAPAVIRTDLMMIEDFR